MDAQQTVAASGSSPRHSPPQNSAADPASPMEEDTHATSHAQRPEASGVQEGGQDANEDSPKGAAVAKKMCAHMFKVFRCTRQSTALAFALSIEAGRIQAATQPSFASLSTPEYGCFAIACNCKPDAAPHTALHIVSMFCCSLQAHYRPVSRSTNRSPNATGIPVLHLPTGATQRLTICIRASHSPASH